LKSPDHHCDGQGFFAFGVVLYPGKINVSSAALHLVDIAVRPNPPNDKG